MLLVSEANAVRIVPCFHVDLASAYEECKMAVCGAVEGLLLKTGLQPQDVVRIQLAPSILVASLRTEQGSWMTAALHLRCQPTAPTGFS